jgi:hypothetical protein
MGIKKIQIVLSFFTVFFLLSVRVLAVPGVPHQFYGSVTINGKPAPDGTIIIAKINGIEVASTTTKNGKYGYEPIFYVDDPEHNRSGEEIKFFVNGIDTGQTKYFCNGCVTKLDLAISQSQGGGGGGRGGGGFVVNLPTKETSQENQTTEKIEVQSCEERWVCSDWSECKNGVQTRSCEDVNNCGTDLNKPLETQPCSEEEKREKTSKAKVTGPTGFFLGLSAVEWIGGIVGGIIIALCVIYFFKRKKLYSLRNAS